MVLDCCLFVDDEGDAGPPVHLAPEQEESGLEHDTHKDEVDHRDEDEEESDVLDSCDGGGCQESKGGGDKEVGHESELEGGVDAAEDTGAGVEAVLSVPCGAGVAEGLERHGEGKAEGEREDEGDGRGGAEAGNGDAEGSAADDHRAENVDKGSKWCARDEAEEDKRKKHGQPHGDGQHEEVVLEELVLREGGAEGRSGVLFGGVSRRCTFRAGCVSQEQ